MHYQMVLSPRPSLPGRMFRRGRNQHSIRQQRLIGDQQAELDDFFTVYLLDPTSMNTDDPNILGTTKGIIENDDTGFSKQSFDIAANSESETIILEIRRYCVAMGTGI